MLIMTRLAVAATLALSSLVSVAQSDAEPKPHVLLISLDGMKPGYVTRADQHGLKVPTLRRFLTEGAYAEGVRGVLPTVTYPSHTTIVTGVWPNEHGIVNNTTFDPMGQHPGEWYWYFNAIKVDTLYTVAHKAGLVTASVSWPVTVGAPIDYLVAENSQSEDTDRPVGDMVNPKDLEQELGVDLHFKNHGVEKSVYKDQRVLAWSLGIINKHKPNLMLVHLSNLDHQEHEHEPFSPQANEAAEILDGQVAQLIDAEKGVDPYAKIFIVSDHGFVAVHDVINTNAWLADAGLITLKQGKLKNGESKVESWQASAWNSGGTAFIVLRDPADKSLEARVRAVIDKMAADPKNGVAKVLNRDQIIAEGGDPSSSFVIGFRPGWATAGAFNNGQPVPKPGTGTHGYLPDFAGMEAIFMVMGPGVAKGKELHMIDQRSIAPTIAKSLGIKLPRAKKKAINLRTMPGWMAQ